MKAADNKQNPTLWIDYLRSFITVLVVFHHSSLAYTTFARFDSRVYINSTHTVVDEQRWIGLDIFQNFNDVFFMSLMFMIGGFFLVHSISRKGAATFIRDRFFRLFLPFFLGGTLLMLIAYFPSYFLASGDTSVASYVKDFFTTQRWPVGPPWFVWLLFVFNIALAACHAVLGPMLSGFGGLMARLKEKPALLIFILFVFSWILYVPLAYKVGAGTWTGLGPFDFQLSRILLYFGYFFLGAMIGGSGVLNSIFSEQSRLVKLWRLWLAKAIVIYILLTLIPPYLIAAMEENRIQAFYAWMIYYTVYISSCVFSCMAFLTLFKARVNGYLAWWDSLSRNAYLIYMVHFIFILWTQFLLLNVDMPVFLKFLLVAFVSLGLSWAVSINLRKIPLINRHL